MSRRWLVSPWLGVALWASGAPAHAQAPPQAPPAGADYSIRLIPLSDATRGYGTHPMAAVWKSYLAEFIQTLP